MKNILFIICSVIFISCNNSNKDKVNSSNNGREKETVEFKILDNSLRDLAELNYKGKIVHKKFWLDSKGENIVLFTKEAHEIFAYHYVIKSGNIRLLREVYDFSEEGCEYDLFADFIEKSITVSDLDNNDIGEITFAYKLACISDVSPLGLKLLILENGNKYIIRGSTKISMGDFIIGGDKEIDPSFKKAPSNFLEHANKIWENIQ